MFRLLPILITVTRINYTLTNFAEHSKKFSHDKINRFLKGEKITPRLIWDNVKSQLVTTESGYLIFDDTVLDKTTKKVMLLIELLNKQYYCPLKNNRQVDESAGIDPYQRVDNLNWSDEELAQGKTIKIKGFRY